MKIKYHNDTPYLVVFDFLYIFFDNKVAVGITRDKKDNK